MERISSSLVFCLMLAAAHAGTSYLGNNAILSQATRATVAANGDSHAIATADPNAASAVLDWTKFNVGSGQTMTFDGSKTTFFNLVDGAAGKSQVDGIINGTAGNVWVINPAGVAFGANAQVNLGGLFAAAAGNVSNADALRAGTAMLPEFSSFDGKVEVIGAQFTADQVALLGKAVTVDGGTFAGDVNVVAAARAVVDDIGGGKVEISVTDFAADPSANTVELGDLVATGNVMSKSGGTSVLGDITTSGGNIDAYTVNGDLTVKADAAIISERDGGEVNLVSAMLDGGAGDILVNGDVVATGGEVRMYAGYGDNSAGGDVTVNGNVLGRGGVGLYAFAGSVKGIGLLGSSESDLFVQASDGDVDLAGDMAARNVIVGASGLALMQGDIFAAESIKIAGDGGIVTDGDLNVAEGNLSLISTDGSVFANGKISARDAYFASGDEVMGLIQAKNPDNDFTGVVTAFGKVIRLTDKNDIHLGDMLANGFVNTDYGGLAIDVYSIGGDLVVERGATVSASSNMGRVNFYAQEGDIIVDGKLRSAAFASLLTGRGDVRVSGVIESSNDVSLNASFNDSVGNVIVDGTVSAGGLIDIWSGIAGGDVIIDGNLRSGEGSTVSADGSEFQYGTSIIGLNGDVIINGNVQSKSDVYAYTQKGDVYVRGGIASEKLAFAEARQGAVEVKGSVAGDSVMIVSQGGGVSIDGDVNSVADTFLNAVGGDVSIGGHVSASGSKSAVVVMVDDFGNVYFMRSGGIRAGETAYVVTERGNVWQNGSVVSGIGNGYVEPVSFASAITAPTVNLKVTGSIGGGGAYLAVNGRVFGEVSGDASIAAANGQPFLGGTNPGPRAFNVVVFDLAYGAASGKVQISFEDVAATSSIETGGNLSIYTAREIEPYGYMLAGGDIAVSASKFGAVSYLRAGGTLTINNVGHPKHPRVAYFTSVDGREPRINNLPNDMVIFVDGRLAGGNVNIMNMFGANEAFLVSTPELKSTQGIFGDPPFLHSDLDVANPMEVSAIDYLIQEVPRLTLSSEFPADVDQKVEANGLSLKDSYWFGQRRIAATSSQTDTDGKVASAEE